MHIKLLFTLILLPTIVLGSINAHDAAINCGAVCLGTTVGATACVACSPCGSGYSIAGLSILGAQATGCIALITYDKCKAKCTVCKTPSFGKSGIKFTVNPFHTTKPQISNNSEISTVNVISPIYIQPKENGFVATTQPK